MVKLYVWWTDEPWAVLLALAAMIAVVGILSIVVVFYMYSRYARMPSGWPHIHTAMASSHVGGPRAFTHPGGPRTYSRMSGPRVSPHVGGPPSSLKEYETQSLNIYVPSDDVTSNILDHKMAVAESSLDYISYADSSFKISGVTRST